MKKFTKKGKVTEDDLKDVIPWEVDPYVTLVIDMDEQVFITAAACEERLVQFTNTLSLSSGLFKNRTQFKDFMQGVDFDKDLFEVEDVQKPEKVSFAINTLKRRLDNICKKTKCHPDNMELYIDGQGNFRDELPLAVKYKGNRENTIRPVLLKELKTYAINSLGAVEIDGMETDDHVVIRVTEGLKEGRKVIGATQDKDARQAEGWWFNYEKEEKPKLVKGFGDLWLDTTLKIPDVKGEGWKFLYYQIICADGADNYCSRDTYTRVLVDGKIEEKRKKPRWGSKTAYTALQKCSNHKQCLELIVKKYKEWYGEEPFEYLDWQDNKHTATWLDVLDMQFQLAYMKRKEDDKTCIKKILKKMGMLDEDK